MKDTSNTVFARTIITAAASLIVLFFIISHSVSAAEVNYSVSGYVFNDLNGNGGWNLPVEKGLEDWIVYNDRNNNFVRDADEEHSNTNETGYYRITDLINGTYRFREELQAHWTQTSAPKTLEFSIEGKDLKDKNFGNIESERVLINPDQVWWLFWIYLFGAIVSVASGLIIFVYGLKNCKCCTIKDNLENIAKTLAGIILIILGVHLLGNLEDISGIGRSHLGVDQLPMWSLMLVIVLLFVALLGVGICKPEQMESGQMRRAIAGLLVFGFVAILIFSLYGQLPIENKEIVSQYIQLVGIIIGFYFGAKITSDASGIKSEIGNSKSIESKIGIDKLDTTKPTYEISVNNLSQDPVMVKRVDLEDIVNSKNIFSVNPEDPFIEGKKSKLIPLTNLDTKKLESIDKLSIKIWTSDGAVREKEVNLEKPTKSKPAE